jgi:hypothetical protein
MTFKEEIAEILIDYRVLANMAFSEVGDGFYTQDEYEAGLKKLGAEKADKILSAVKRRLPEKKEEKDPPEELKHTFSEYEDYDKSVGFNQAIEQVEEALDE